MVENLCFKIDIVINELINNLLKFDFKKPYKVFKKNDNSFVTSIDLEIQRLILNIIKANFFECNLICEEENLININKNNIYTWVVDPIDGTKNFINNKKEFSISIGLMKKNRFISSLVYFPKLNEYYVTQGNFITRNGEKYDLPSEHLNPKKIILCSKTYNRYEKILKDKGYMVECYTCATYSLLELIKKNAYIYHIINTNIYDVGPMSHILKLLGFSLFTEQLMPYEYLPELKLIPFIIFTDDIFHATNFMNEILIT